MYLAIPELIKLLDIEFSIDAMGCQVSIAEHIVEQGGNYLFTLKCNQGNLHKGRVGHWLRHNPYPATPLQFRA
jgi:predicted transposase YbfD/YdcC